MRREEPSDLERLRHQLEQAQGSQRLADGAGDVLLAEQAERQAREQARAQGAAEREERERPQRLAMLHMPTLSVELKLPPGLVDALMAWLERVEPCADRCTRRCPFRK